MSYPLFVLSGPSGVGKDTVAKRFLEKYSSMEKCISATTRKPRPGEVDGENYFFVTEEEFSDMVNNGKFLEHQTVHGNSYGTLFSELERIRSKGKIPFMILDVQGVNELTEKNVDMRSIFILPPSDAELFSRLYMRGTENPREAQARFIVAQVEINNSQNYDFHIVNDDVDVCVDRLAAIVDAELEKSRTVKNIVLTGGPCAGKTSAISRIVNDFSGRGWSVMVVPEAATDLIGSGIRPWELSNSDYQKVAMEEQLFRENITRQAAFMHPNDKILILHDRGCMDQGAYMNSADFDSLLQSEGLSESEVLSRYDSVIHLRTAAYGAEEFYTLSNNSARTETPDEARAKDDITLKMWSDHPNLRIIPNDGSFEDKLQSVVSVIFHDIGEPLVKDVQRKFVVQMPSQEWFDSCDIDSVSEVVTDYLYSKEPQESRIRAIKHGDSWIYTKTDKTDTGNGLSRLVSERILTEDEYFNTLNLSKSSNEKIRHNFNVGKICGVVDIYPNDSELAVLEIRSTGDSDGFVVPEGINVVKEVTDSPNFRNKTLSEMGDGVSLSDLLKDSGSVQNAPLEIEVKLLLDNIDVDAFRELDGCTEKHIKQTYLDVPLPGETRLRSTVVDGKTSYFLTNKQTLDDGFSRIEDEREVSASEARILLQSADKSREPIVKDRFVIPDGNRKIEVDVYPDAAQSAVLEVELSSDRPEDLSVIDGKEDRLSVLPDWFPATVVGDVTEMSQFKNGSLSKHFPEAGLVSMYKELISDMPSISNTRDISDIKTSSIDESVVEDTQFE